MSVISDRLKSIREDKKMTQAELAGASGVHRVQIAKYETERAVPTFAVLQKLAEALGVSVAAFTEEAPASEEKREWGRPRKK